jgi:hypothetical protein
MDQMHMSDSLRAPISAGAGVIITIVLQSVAVVAPTSGLLDDFRKLTCRVCRAMKSG